MTTQKQDELIASYNKKCNELNELKQKNHMLLELRELDNKKLYDLTREVDFYKTIDHYRNQELTEALEAKDQISRLLTEADKKISALEFQNNSLADQYIESLQDLDKYKSELADIKKNRNVHLNRKLKLYSERKGLNQRITELEAKVKELQDQANPVQSSGINPSYDSNNNDLVVPLSATPGWGQLGFLDPDTGYQPITKVSPTKVTIATPDLKITSGDSKPIGWTDGVLSGRAEWNDYHTGG